MRTLSLLLSVTCLLLSATTTVAGPDWIEEGDAGGLPPGAQSPKGSGPMSSIGGELEAAVVAGIPVDDTEDMYRIFIRDPALFSASTVPTNPDLSGFAKFDSQLWLFDMDGRPLLANDDFIAGESGSQLQPNSNDGTNLSIPGPGVYLLAITAFDRDPISMQGNILFNQMDRTEVSGPDGPEGAMTRIDTWGGPPSGFGGYLIGVTGVEFPPAIPTVSSWGMAVLFVLTAIAGTLCVRRCRPATS